MVGICMSLLIKLELYAEKKKEERFIVDVIPLKLT